MATRIRTLNFLPDIFRTTTNSQFLNATLDQIVDQPNTMKIEGFVGSKFGYGVNAKNRYVVEPNKTRTDYQLDPGVVFLKKDTSTAQDFISYPGIIDSLKLNGGITNDNSRLFESQFYSWDSFTNLDKLINYNQYYWVPNGPESVVVSTDTVYSIANYIVTDQVNGYLITDEANGTSFVNPQLTLLRGGTYTFRVNQGSQFWIQGAPGVTGYDPSQTNIQTRDVLGVINNGTTEGVVTFTVPEKDAQSEYNLPGDNYVDVVSSLAYGEINGQTVSSIGGIDGITSLNGLTLMLYNTGEDDPVYFYDITLSGDPADPTINLSEGSAIPINEKITVRYGTQWISRHFFKSTYGVITVVPYLSSLLDTLYYQDGTSSNKVGKLVLIQENVSNRIDVENDILGKKTYTSPNGVVFTNGLKVIFEGNVYPSSYENNEYYVEGVGTAIELVPTTTLISPEPFTVGEYVPYDILPYDIGNYDITLYVPQTPDYITIARNSINRNAWSRSNRWFHIDVLKATATYNNDPALLEVYTSYEYKAKRPIIEFYPNLKLFDSGIVGKNPVNFIDTRTTDAFSLVAGQENYYPDVETYTGYDATINQFDITTDIITTTATYTLVNPNNVIGCTSTAGFTVNDLVEFTGTTFGGVATDTVYYIQSIVDSTKFRISDQPNGDPIILTSGSGSMAVTVTPLSTTIELPDNSIVNSFQVGQYVTDSTGVLPDSTQIQAIVSDGTTTTLTVHWDNPQTVLGATNASLVADDLNNTVYQLFDGARIIFAADTDNNVRNKIYVVHFSVVDISSPPVITLTPAEDALVLPEEQVTAFNGYHNQGKTYFFDGDVWNQAQQKLTVNQAPLFDVFDKDGISFGNPTYYQGTTFTGNKLFAFATGTGTVDTVLGIPLLYSSVDNVGDITFDVSLNSASFKYVDITNNNPITQNVNTGYVYNYSNLNTKVRELGWQTAVGDSVQYQLFEFNYYADTPTTAYTCDIAKLASTDTVWPTIQLSVNNVIQPSTDYTVTVGPNFTTINYTVPDITVDTVIQVALLSTQVSSIGYYGIPINLQNNPLNADLTSLNVGDIRGQYQSIFYNNPNTTGEVFGSNNYRDLGNLVPWGTKIIQNSASLVLPGTFLRQQNHNLFNALMYNSKEYINFKTLLVGTVNNTDYNRYQTAAFMLDDALEQITANKTDGDPFFWSDMLPNKSAYITNTYTFANALDTSIYPLSRVYNFDTANYYGVLVYLTRNNIQTQLIAAQDYVVSTDTPSLTITYDLLAGDLVTIKEYNQTYGSYVPNTPTKLGLYPATIPTVVLDSGYQEPTYFIVGHDGSYNKLYGDYINGQLIDFRDQVLLEFEKRVYNNLKLGDTIPVTQYDVIPGFFRTTDYSYQEILQIYTSNFLNWVGQNRVDYKTQYYNANNQYTYNYNRSGNKINNQVIEQGYWRGIYQNFYDTASPDTMPWQMIGFTDMPTWWIGRYGPAPYTSDNLVLWNDLAQGINWNNGNPVVLSEFVRPELLQVLPVDTNGDLVSPFDAIVGNYSNQSFLRDWRVGDVGPAEFSYRRSSSWPFDLMKILALTRPAQFYNLGVDLDNYRYNSEFNQYLVNNRSHLVISNIEVYGSGIAKTSYLNWVVDYEKQVGVDATTNITELLDNLDVRLVYRLAGFSDKDMLKFYVEKGTPNSRNASLLIPDESFAVLLYDNPPFDNIVYSSVIVQQDFNGYFKIYGNSQTNAYFNILKPVINGNYDTVSVGNVSVKLPNDYTQTQEVIAYGTTLYSIQEVATFLQSYGRYLADQGVLFDQIETGLEVNWAQMVAEFLYWAQSGWEVGSIVNINPAAKLITINREDSIVQPLTLQQQNFILNQNMYPIQAVDLSVIRDGTLFSAQPLNQGDTVAYGQFNIHSFEHGIVFDNQTLFNDTIYNLTTGLRQSRIYVRGSKTADWNGTVDAQGFILNQDNILDWSPNLKYTTGSIVKYKNKYWTALRVIQPSLVFQELDWKETDYNEIQKGLLPNSSTRSYESTLYYDVNQANLEQDADLLSFSLIGYRPRDYLTIADLTDITQINVYKNLIKNKGTRNALDAFKGANLPQGGIDYDVYENWAIKSGEFGGVLNNNFVEFKLSQPSLTGNPSIVGLTNGVYNDGVQQEVPIYSLYNYGRPVQDPNILSTIPVNTQPTLFSDAGYVNFNDVKISSFYYSGLSTSTTPLDNLYVGDYVWLANYQSTWNVMSPVSQGRVILARSVATDVVTLTFAEPHNITKYTPFALVNFSASLNGYYVANSIVDPYTIAVTIPNLGVPFKTAVTGTGEAFTFQSHRCAKPSDIINLPLLENEFNINKVWVDTASNGSWGVYRKTTNYLRQNDLIKASSQTYGSSVATLGDVLGFLVADSDRGEVYRYVYNDYLEEYVQKQIIAGDSSFGTSITYSGYVVAISQPTGATQTDRKVKIYQYDPEDVLAGLQLIQTITAPSSSVTDWGHSIAMSMDQNWLFVSSTATNEVYVYYKNQITGDYEYSSTVTVSGLALGDNFGYSMSTNYYGDTLVVGAPNIDDGNTNVGAAFVFDRLYQSFEATATTTSPTASTFTLATSYTNIIGVFINGTVLDTADYSVVGSTLTVTASLTIGDIVTVNTATFVLSQRFDSEEITRVGPQFGTSVATNKYGKEILVGAPFEIRDITGEGAVYRYTNAGASYGSVTGTTNTAIISNTTILINGYAVALAALSNASLVAQAINDANVTNVRANATDGKLSIYLANPALATINDKLSIAVLNSTVWAQLGIDLFTKTQIVTCPHVQGATQFGTVIKFNEADSFVVGAPTGTRYSSTTFDSTDDANFDNDTIFDNNTTVWVDTFRNAGAAYMFDYLSNYNETLDNIGNYVYAQSLNDLSLEYGNQPNYGKAVDFSQYDVIVGAPQYREGINNGQATIFTNTTGQPDWSIYRYSAPIVDVNKIQNAQLFSAETNQTLDNLDYIDPLQGKILGSVRQNINVVSNADPANYNSALATNKGSRVWGAGQVGHLWLNTTNVKFVNYHQNDDVVYNSKYWGTVFPGSDVAVYSWIASDSLPVAYQGSGTPYDLDSYVVQFTQNATGDLVPVYYYWVRNTNIVFTKAGKTLSDSILQTYIANPSSSGVSYFAPLLPNVFGLYNSGEYINANDTVFHIGFGTGTSDDVSHSVYDLIRDGVPEDFLPGLPESGTTDQPISLYDRMLDSLSGTDETGDIVPDPFLPKAVQSGIYARPRQSFFVDRFGALKNYLTYANEVLALYPITEIRPDVPFLNEVGPINPTTGLPFYDTTKYWNPINWWATGYDNNTKSALQVPIYADLSALNVPVGTIVTVASNSAGNAETYVLQASGWTRIGLQNGTIEFKAELWDYELGKFGFAGNFFDTNVYDDYPSEETRYIIRALNEQIYTDELLTYRNKSLILLFTYIQAETIETQNYLPWLNKTSLVDVSHTIRELKPIEVFQSDNQDFLSGYVNEAKPYHVVIKEFLFKYTGIDVFEGDITDFDLPSQFDFTVNKFMTPELVYANPSSYNQFLPTDTIWNQNDYNQWYQNYGLSLTDIPNYNITYVSSYVTLNAPFIVVDNANGLPVSGTVIINGEQIGYTSVDRQHNLIQGLVRGLNGTAITQHYPGEEVFIDLPALVVINEGRGYINPPKVNAVIDTTKFPEPRTPMQFKPIMNLDKIMGIEVLNPGDGYAVMPEIVIDPSITEQFNSSDVNLLTNTIRLSNPTLVTGDLVRYVTDSDSSTIGGLSNGQYYYVNVLDVAPTFIIALYTSYSDAIDDINRVVFYDTGSGTHTVNVSAKAIPITNSSPVRENQIILRFDRTTYNSDVTTWTPNTFYSSYYLGLYNNRESIASSSINLSSNISPNIQDVLSSLQGLPFLINNVSNNVDVSWSNRVRNVEYTFAVSNAIRIVSTTDGVANEGDVGPTTGFYVGMPIQFTGTAFGGLAVDVTYYVLEVLSPNTFSVTATQGSSTPVSLIDAAAGSATLSCHAGVVSDTVSIDIEYPNIRTVVATTATTDEITIDQGTSGLYPGIAVNFVGNVFGGIIENQVYFIKEVVDSLHITISSNPSLTDTVQLTTATGSVTINIGTPVSPGQLNGQKLTFYETLDTPYTNVSGTVGNLVDKTILVTTALGDCVTLRKTFSGISNIYANMPMRVSANIGNLVTGTTYYVTEVGYLSPTVTSTSSTGDILTCTSTQGFYSGMPITFSGTSIGNIPLSTEYFVKTVISSTQFTISDTVGGATLPIGDQNGLMASSGAPYVKLSTTMGGSNVTLADASGLVGLTQYPGTTPVFDVSYKLGGYTAVIVNTGSGYAIDNTITIPGNLLGGVTGTNDAVFAVDSINSTGGIVTLICGGKPVGRSNQYYIKVLSNTSCEIYTDPLLQVPVTGAEFIYGSNDYAFLPEPFYFNQSIVTYNGIVYKCIISNNDDTFVSYKWEALDSGSRELNELDRIIAYYKPTVDMPGVDITQLITGTTYPNPTYYGNAFDPENEYPLDTILHGPNFYPSELDIKAVAFGENSYIAPAEAPDYSATLVSGDSNTWLVKKITDQPVLVSDIMYAGGMYVITTNNTSTPIFISEDGETWVTNGYFVPFGALGYDTTPYDYSAISCPSTMLNGLSYNDGLYVAVGEMIVVSTDLYSWSSTFVFTSGINNIFKDVTYVDIPSFTGFVAVGESDDVGIIYTSVDGLVWTDTGFFSIGSGLMSVSSNSDYIVTVGENGAVYISSDAITWDEIVTGYPAQLNHVEYGNGKFVAVGNDGTVVTAPDVPTTWTLRATTTIENLNGVTYSNSLTQFIAVGENNTILRSEDGILWSVDTILETEETVYTVQGSPFLSGYGPEELVPGVVSDNLTMIVTTRPGTNWDSDIYQHVGYNVVSTEITPSPSTQTVFSFDNLVETPAGVSVFDIDSTTGLAIRLYETSDYSIDWVTKTVTLVNPITDGNTLMIEVYEVGNGDQLTKSNTDYDPLRVNSTSGFQEINLGCNYSATITSGSGVIRPSSFPVNIVATETSATDNTIVCDDVTQLTLNQIVTFQGVVFGNVAEDTNYYVKTISLAGNRITISETEVDGVAGPVFTLSDGTGSMQVVVQTGSGLIWADPNVQHNGTRLTQGSLIYVSKTNVTTNTIVCNTTGGLSVNDTIVFGDTIDFESMINPHTVYYVKQVIDNNEFTISTTQGGSVLELIGGSGGATAITNDYTFGIASDGVSAKMILSAQYDTTYDYLTYTILGETNPSQYGYTLPETEEFTGTGGTEYTLSNYVSGDNPDNAIVEVDGLRLNDSEYTINSSLQTITFVSAPAVGSNIAVTSFNDTQRQAFNTQFNSIGNTVSSIIGISNSISTPATVGITSANGSNEFVCADTSGIVAGQTVLFKAPLSAFGGVAVDGTVYYIESVTGPTTFTISATQYGSVLPLTVGSGVMFAYVGGQPAVRVTTGSAHNLAENDVVRLDGIVGSVQLNNNTYYAKVINTTQFDLYTAPYDPAYLATNYPVIAVNSYMSGGYAWVNETFVVINDWELTNVNRLWVTVNGYRVPSSSLVLNSGNNLSILVEINIGDSVTITSMIPSATPNQLVYIQNVNKTHIPSVYRADVPTTTWLTAPLRDTDDTIYVYDVSRIVDKYEDTVVVPGTYNAITEPVSVPLIVDKRLISQIIVVDVTTDTTLNSASYYVELVDTAPVLIINGEINIGDTLNITVYLGNTLYINGEQIRFTTVNYAENTVTGLQRGANGTGMQHYIDEYSRVYGILSQNRMSEPDYAVIWNSEVYDTDLGDPLQISDTVPAFFLRNDEV